MIEVCLLKVVVMIGSGFLAVAITYDGTKILKALSKKNSESKNIFFFNSHLLKVIGKCCCRKIRFLVPLL